MDNFMDKIAQKWNAQDLIKANSAAEALELKKLQAQVMEYERILQEMRKLNLRNVELNDKVQSLVGEGFQKLPTILEEAQLVLEGIKQKEENKENADGLSEKMEDFVHKENVKVYRNVQAVFTEGMAAQTELLTAQTIKVEKAAKSNTPLLVVLIVLVIMNMGIGVVQILNGIFGIFF